MRAFHCQRLINVQILTHLIKLNVKNELNIKYYIFAEYQYILQVSASKDAQFKAYRTTSLQFKFFDANGNSEQSQITDQTAM